jgi:hypothetical protein
LEPILKKIKEKMTEKKELFYQVFIEGMIKFRGNEIGRRNNVNDQKKNLIRI